MAKRASTAATKTAKPAAVASEETLKQLEAGLRPYTLISGRHYETEFDLNGVPGLSKPYGPGDVVYSNKNLFAIHGEKFAEGIVSITGAAVVITPGLGESVNEAIDTNGFDVYAKGGVMWAFVPGAYGSPASGPLVDLAAAEEWCSENDVNAE